MRILILGGYGVFGGRLAHLLADEPRLTLLIAGRDEARARAFCASWTGAATVAPVRADRAALGDLLARERVEVVVDASGPFQAYGLDPTAAVRAALAAGAHYLDLADGTDFVAGIARFDAEAREKGLLVLSGVSSFPVLTAAVVAEAAQKMTVRGVAGGIAPSPHAGVGLNVLRAVLGYAGAPVRLWRDGREGVARGLVASRRWTVGPPGELPLRPLRFSLVEVPDLFALPQAFPSIGTTWMGAAPQPAPLHALLSALAWVRGVIGGPSLAPLAPLAQAALDLAPKGAHRGGMVVEVTGEAGGRPVTRAWHLLAEGDHGPLIPSMAVALLVRRLLAGRAPPPGARSGIGALTLADYAEAFAGRRIVTGWREAPAGSLYERLLGDAYRDLPPEVQALHRPGRGATWAGRAEVRRGRGPVAALAARLFGFPATGSEVPVEVRFAVDDRGAETWERRFAGRPMRSVQAEGRGRDALLLVERFGALAVALALVREGDRLRLIPRRWSLGPLPLPRALLPRGETFETARDGRFRFHVEIALPLLGRLVTYEGWLRPARPGG